MVSCSGDAFGEGNNAAAVCKPAHSANWGSSFNSCSGVAGTLGGYQALYLSLKIVEQFYFMLRKRRKFCLRETILRIVITVPFCIKGPHS